MCRATDSDGNTIVLSLKTLHIFCFGHLVYAPILILGFCKSQQQLLNTIDNWRSVKTRSLRSVVSRKWVTDRSCESACASDTDSPGTMSRDYSELGVVGDGWGGGVNLI